MNAFTLPFKRATALWMACFAFACSGPSKDAAGAPATQAPTPNAKPMPIRAESPEAAAKAGLVVLKSMIDVQGMARMGFPTMKSVAEAQVNTHIPLISLSCDALKKPGSSLESFVVRRQEFFFVGDAGRNRTAIYVDSLVETQDPASLKAPFLVTAMGDARIVRDLDSASLLAQRVKERFTDKPLYVSIPGAKLAFWATSLDAKGYALPLAYSQLPCLGKWKQPEPWATVMKRVNRCVEFKRACADTLSGSIPPELLKSLPKPPEE